MKTTLDIPDDLFKQAKHFAVNHGISLKHLVSEALQAKLLSEIPVPSQKPWMKLTEMFPTTAEFREEVSRIEKIIENEFERIDEDDWK